MNSNDDENDDDDENEFSSQNNVTQEDISNNGFTEYKSLRLANPLPGFKDPITMEQIEKPTISPFGHVMGFDTWIRILNQEPMNKCPFTKQDLYKKDLIRLNFDNISEYQDKIKNNFQ